MLITEIKPIDKKRFRVYIDGEPGIVLYGNEINKYEIRENCEISEVVYREITEIILPKRCKLRAMNLLQKRDYTTRQLTDKLKEGMYPQDIIDEAIEYVTSYRYLDDDRYARDYITYHMSTRSRNRIIQDLTSKGIDRDTIITLMDEIYQEDQGEAELDQIKKLLARKNYDPENTDFKEKQKIMAFLMRKGFSLADIQKVMSVGDY
jgi:regulatory protein